AIGNPDVEVDVPRARGGQALEHGTHRLDVDAMPSQVIETAADGADGRIVGADIDVKASRLPGKGPIQEDVFPVLRVRNQRHIRFSSSARAPTDTEGRAYTPRCGKAAR